MPPLPLGAPAPAFDGEPLLPLVCPPTLGAPALLPDCAGAPLTPAPCPPLPTTALDEPALPTAEPPPECCGESDLKSSGAQAPSNTAHAAPMAHDRRARKRTRPANVDSRLRKAAPARMPQLYTLKDQGP